MIPLLEEVNAAAPLLDKAGGHRVLALVLLRAPGWPAGPGDPEAALDHARTADQLVADDADNLLALGEALAENGDANGARLAYGRALRIARQRAAAGDPDAADVAAAAAAALGRLPR
jgi:cytochrome c-type biogenesis protein CcmH/NrfG